MFGSGVGQVGLLVLKTYSLALTWGCDHLFEEDDSYSLEIPHSGHKEPRMPSEIWRSSG